MWFCLTVLALIGDEHPDLAYHVSISEPVAFGRPVFRGPCAYLACPGQINVWVGVMRGGWFAGMCSVHQINALDFRAGP